VLFRRSKLTFMLIFLQFKLAAPFYVGIWILFHAVGWATGAAGGGMGSSHRWLPLRFGRRPFRLSPFAESPAASETAQSWILDRRLTRPGLLELHHPITMRRIWSCIRFGTRVEGIRRGATAVV